MIITTICLLVVVLGMALVLNSRNEKIDQLETELTIASRPIHTTYCPTWDDGRFIIDPVTKKYIDTWPPSCNCKEELDSEVQNKGGK